MKKYIWIALILAGCTTATQIAYTSLDAVGAAENAAMTQAAIAYHNGTMSYTTWDSITNKHALFLISYDAAVLVASTTAAAAPTNVIAMEQTISTLSTNK